MNKNQWIQPDACVFTVFLGIRGFVRMRSDLLPPTPQKLCVEKKLM